MDTERVIAGARERLEQRAGHTGSIGPDCFSDEAVVTSSSHSKFLAELKPEPGSGVLKVLPPSAVPQLLCSRKPGWVCRVSARGPGRARPCRAANLLGIPENTPLLRRGREPRSLNAVPAYWHYFARGKLRQESKRASLREDQPRALLPAFPQCQPLQSQG